MRFFADGPNIPDELLQSRDDGNVVFFCGAGVSLSAGLPNFINLAEHVVEELGAPPNSKVRAALVRATQDPEGAISLDQIFSLLHHEYSPTLVSNTIAKVLKTPQLADTSQHSIVLRLSKNAGHQPQIVTTNFDLLFERAQKGILKYVSPALPDLSSGQPLLGLVYLHGRLSDHPSGQPHQLVISSSDFGRAYLADAWATRFVRDLLRNYVIVLLGYSANDPPIRYLLEGLHARSPLESNKIFAFDQGDDVEVASRWRDRGVVPLAYPKSDAQHSGLWRSLAAWADRADSPEQWQQSIVRMAANNPKDLKPHERGQVASVLRTTAGAKLFSKAPELPPAEWICVFDRSIRYGEPRGSSLGSEPIDPLLLYGLDTDNPRSEDPKDNISCLDILSTSPFDEKRENTASLVGPNNSAERVISARLFYLSQWFVKVLDQPSSFWWAAGYRSLHQRLIELIQWQVDRSANSLDQATRTRWQTLLFAYKNSPIRQLSGTSVIAQIKKNGWSTRLHRLFEEAMLPQVAAKRAFLSGPTPPQQKPEKNDYSAVEFEVEFPTFRYSQINIPDEDLYRCFRSARRGLERGSELLEEIGTSYWKTASFINDDRPGSRHLSAADSCLHWVKELFERLTGNSPHIARREFDQWPVDDPYFFDKLKIHALKNNQLFSAEEAENRFLSLSDDAFWNTYHRRELLTTLKLQWNRFTSNAREAIERKIIRGESAWIGETEEQANMRRSSTAASLLNWLRANGCNLSDRTSDQLPALETADARWNMKWAQAADASFDARAAFVEVKTTPAKIADLPIANIIEGAERLSPRDPGAFTEYRPFSGLATLRPARALAALAYQARRSKYPTKYWQAFLTNCPKEIPSRLRLLISERLYRLPKEIICEMPHEITRWLQVHAVELATSKLERVLATWDIIVGSLSSGGKAVVASAMGQSFAGGKPLNRSRRTYDHAINGPLGVLTDTLLSLLNSLKRKQNSGIPDNIKMRLEVALSFSGAGGDHAICEAMNKLNWLFFIDRAWAEKFLIPMLSLSDPRSEPAWNGYLHCQQLSEPELFALLKTDFLNLFEHYHCWNWDHYPIQRLHEFLVVACRWNSNSKSYISYADARIALQRSGDEGRSHSLWFLSTFMPDHVSWKSFGEPFITKAWPKEKRFQTEQTSRQFLSITEDAADNFPSVVSAISQFLVPAGHLDLFMYKLESDGGIGTEATASLPRKFPRAMLELLSPLVSDDPDMSPYELASILEVIVDAEPALRQDSKWRRLNRIAHSR